MEPYTSHSAIAADGGGSHCRLALSSKGKTWQVIVGATNVSSNFDAAVAEITKGLHALRKAANWDSDTFYNIPSYLGLAGVTGDVMAARVAEALPLLNICVEEDRSAALKGALGDQEGYLMHCGTGSFLGRQTGKNTCFAGGWGPVLGDPGSAHWIGKELLVRSLKANDGLCQSSTLSRDTLQRFNGPAGIIAWASTATQTEIAELAPLVTQAAEQDTLAQSILHNAASQLAGMLKDFGWDEASPICLTGGIGAIYANYLPHEFQSALIKPLGSPLEGAMALAQSFAAAKG